MTQQMWTRDLKSKGLICNENKSDRDAPVHHHSHNYIWRQLECDVELAGSLEDPLYVLVEQAHSL